MRSTRAIIDLDALAWNFSVIKRHVNAKAILGMVKANAYGHGMEAIAHTLQELGVDMLGTAILDEALQLRLAGISTPIMVLTPIEPNEVELAVAHNIVTVACDVSQVRALSEAAVGVGGQAEVHLYVDTGMLRDGFRAHDVPEAASTIMAMPGILCTGICTHFATSDEHGSAFLTEQLSTFTAVLAKCESVGCTFATVHAANTGAMWQSELSHFTMVRPGISLYGYASPANNEMTLHPVMAVTSRVLSRRRAFPGETVSYGRRYMVSTSTTIVTVPIGYGDGYLRSLTGKAQVLIGGVRYPVVGTICMDEIMVDIGDANVQIGDEVVLLGRQARPDGHLESIDAVELAEWAHTIPYEITTSVSARVPRIYRGHDV